MEEQINNSDKNAEALFETVKLKECNDLVPYPKAENTSNETWKCGTVEFKVDKACADDQWYNENCIAQGQMKRGGNNSHHRCTVSVKGHLKVGGIPWTGSAGNGYEMRKNIGQYGFKKIAEGDEVNTKSKMNEWTRKYARKGDVCIMTNGDKGIYPEYQKNKDFCGHACMFTGSKWISDFIQDEPLIYNANIYSGVQVWRFEKCGESN